MYFPESDIIAARVPELVAAIEVIDECLAEMATGGILQEDVLASHLRLDSNQVGAVFELLAEAGLLQRVEFLECERCRNLMPKSDLEQSIKREEPLECSDCQHVIGPRTKLTVAYRLSCRTVDRKRAHLVKRKVVLTKHRRPRPEEQTVAKVWTTRDGTLHFSTKTGQESDGAARFPLVKGKPTLQSRLMQILISRNPDSVRIDDLLYQLYPDHAAQLSTDASLLKEVFKKFRSLVSDIRKKFDAAGIRPEVLPSLDLDAVTTTGIRLRVAHVHCLDDKELDAADRPPSIA